MIVSRPDLSSRSRSGDDVVPARLHLRRAPGLVRGRAGQPRHLRARGPARARAATTRTRFRATLEKLLDLPIVGDVRGDGYFYGIELVKDKATKETFDDDESRAAAARLPVQGAVRRGPLLPRRRPRRPGHPARAAADLRPGATSTRSSRSCARCSPRPRTASDWPGSPRHRPAAVVVPHGGPVVARADHDAGRRRPRTSSWSAAATPGCGPLLPAAGAARA